MKRIEVDLDGRSYPVSIDSGMLRGAGKLLRPFVREGRLFVVSDENVWREWGPTLLQSLGEAGVEPKALIFPPGEGSKSWNALIELTNRLLAHGIERGETIVAFGGGVIGDLAGFAAAILKRGCPYVQIPTSLLAQVDSSIGGKTAINTNAGKNLVGTFHQPAAVFIDPDVLTSLPERHLRAGYAEVVKYGLIGDPVFFHWCEKHGRALIDGSEKARAHAIAVSVQAKAAIVAEDERETSGRRALLNFGHTFAHALEAETGFGDALLHGEAVALGMVLALRFSAERDLCTNDVPDRVTTHLRSAGLPTELRDAGISGSADALVEHMAQDKKKADGRVPFILSRGIGEAYVHSDVDLADVGSFLARQLAR